MGIVQMTVNLSNDLTTVKVVGTATSDDIRFWVKDFYAGSVTQLVVWDLVNANLAEIEPDMMTDEISAHVRQVNEVAAEVRRGGKTAYVVGDNAPALTLCAKIIELAEAMGSPFERKIFTNLDEAQKWLGV